MNLVLFASGGLCWRNTQSDRGAGVIVEWIRRFGFTGLVFAFLLAGITSPVAAQSQQSETVTVSFLDAQRAFNDTAQSYNEARAEYARSLYLIDSATGNSL